MRQCSIFHGTRPGSAMPGFADCAVWKFRTGRPAMPGTGTAPGWMT